MNVLGLDPGSENSALLLWDGKAVGHHAILTNRELLAVLDEPQPWAIPCDYIACEMIQSFGMAVGAEVFETCYLIGRIEQICAYRQMRFVRIYRKEVKKHLCHDIQAKDTNIRQAILDRFGGREKAIGIKAKPGPLYSVHSHMFSALAVAITAFDRLNQPPTDLP